MKILPTWIASGYQQFTISWQNSLNLSSECKPIPVVEGLRIPFFILFYYFFKGFLLLGMNSSSVELLGLLEKAVSLGLCFWILCCFPLVRVSVTCHCHALLTTASELGLKWSAVALPFSSVFKIVLHSPLSPPSLSVYMFECFRLYLQTYGWNVGRHWVYQDPCGKAIPGSLSKSEINKTTCSKSYLTECYRREKFQLHFFQIFASICERIQGGDTDVQESKVYLDT